MEKPVLIFDHDGTLHDSMHVFGPAVHGAENWIREQGYDIKTVDDSVIASCLGLNKIDMWNTFAYGLSDNVMEKMIAFMYEEMNRLLKVGAAKWFDGVTDMLSTLKERGYHLVILSNCEIELAKFYSDYFNVEKWFDKFYDCESYGFAPKTEIIKVILKEYGGRGVMIGDRDSDFDCARSGGIPFIGCAYGFGSRDELEGAYAIAESPLDIPDIVDKLAGDN